MKVVILAGGLGTRISEYTKLIPKPMIPLKGKPIIYYIMKHFYNYGFKNFYVAIGYKGIVLKNFFKKNNFPWDVKLIETGQKTMTGGRLKRLKKHIGNERFFMTYGDGLSDVNLKSLLNFHIKNKKIATLTAVRPPARFGKIKLNQKNNVILFREKSSLDEGWINGGFFVLEPEIFPLIKSDQTFFEKEPLQKLSQKRQLKAFQHKKIWQCMDTVRDKEILEKLLLEKKLKF
ncbi:sugar phosphate nucleotidyltransferase [Candidatus Pelagibacter sp. HIMB1321]|uniref:sugar phosphate nucleotidyltransferase n=1 Tax=Candidatus Pelagibacter sp. HIMB1321 TaxID=1388755 RepID=UPI000A07F991|nr:sugar phosphate nucleotidyltransferase [Candidatus Pelagibacter sp. HIMB1321]SMF79524.1 glucose-1-phosphate cytidylyltransferase [Candidatus Pelagibacter sp. HIMB1321]